MLSEKAVEQLKEYGKALGREEVPEADLREYVGTIKIFSREIVQALAMGVEQETGYRRTLREIDHQALGRSEPKGYIYVAVCSPSTPAGIIRVLTGSMAVYKVSQKGIQEVSV